MLRRILKCFLLNLFTSIILERQNYSAYVLENHNDLLVIQYELNETDTETYGNYFTEVGMYDTKRKLVLREKDAVQPTYFDSLNSSAKKYYPWMFKDNSPTLNYNMEFGGVTQEGILMLGSGNHGWIYNFCFFPMQDTKAVLKKTFIERYLK